MNIFLLLDFLIAKIKTKTMNKNLENDDVLVAVYGTLRQGWGNHRLLENDESTLLGTCKTEPKYTMYHLGGFPAVAERGNTSLTIEVYKVSPRVKQRLDGLEGHNGKGNKNNFYDITTVNTEFGEANMYVINNREFSKLIPSGDWKDGYSKY